jgi:hypothetical protein
LFKKEQFEVALNIPLKFPGFEKSGQHYWEIDAFKYRKSRIVQKIRQHFVLKKTVKPILDNYHLFFVLDNLEDKG